MSSASSESVKAGTIIVRAGAGAGKTTELIRRVIDFIREAQTRSDKDPRLCLTTFTRKATQEVRERLLAKALEIGDEKLLRYVQQSRSLHISTIHGTLRRYLSQYGSAFGFSPELNFIDVRQETRVIKTIIRRLLRSRPELIEALEIIFEEWDPNTLVIAFQTWSLHRVRFPDSRPSTRDEILDDQKRAFVLLEDIARDFHAELCRVNPEKAWKYLQDWLGRILSHKNRTMDTWRQVGADQPKVRKTKAIPDSLAALKDEFEARLDAVLQWNASSEFTAKAARLGPAFDRVAQAIDSELFHWKTSRSLLTINDLETYSLRLMKEHPQTAARFSSQWDFWLIDEYQDTSPLQVEILRGLVGNGLEFVVGDPQQSIYLFRGARSEVFEEREKFAMETGGERLFLRKNYRSSPALMSFLNAFLVDFSPQLSTMEIGREEDGKWTSPSALFWTTDYGDLAVLERVQELLAAGVSPEQICVLTRKNSELQRLAGLAKEYSIPVHVHASRGYVGRREVKDALALLRFLVNPEDNVNLVELLRSPWFPAEDSFLAEISHRGEQSYWRRWRENFSDRHTDLRSFLEKGLEAVEFRGLGSVWQELLIERGMIDWSHQVDGSGRREGNLWKLTTELQWAERQPGFSYAQFISDQQVDGVLDEEQVDVEAPTVVEPRKVSLMTIHASKGLQFEHVILPDVGADPQFKIKKSFLITDEKTSRWEPGLKDPDTGRLECSFWALGRLEEYKERERAEYDRLFYVALTRAKRSVTLIWSQVRRNSWAEKFHARLSDYNEWAECRDRDPAPIKVSIEESSAVSVRPPWQSRESFEPVEPLRLKIAESGLTVSALAKIQKGVEVHRQMEALQWDWKSATARPWRERLQKETAVDMEHLIRQGFSEWAFLIKEGGKLVQGRIDLWGRDAQGRPWIIDYKTGDEKYREKAFEQLRFYAWALYTVGAVTRKESIHLLPVFFSAQPLEPEIVGFESVRLQGAESARVLSPSLP